MNYFRWRYLISTLLAVILLAACQPNLVETPTQSRSTTDSIVSVYLNYTSTADFRLEIQDLELRSKDIWLPCRGNTSDTRRSSRQHLIALDALPAAQYDQVRFRVELYSEQNTLLRTEQVTLGIANHLLLKPSGSQCLFLHCRLSPYTLDRPLPEQFVVENQVAPLADNLLYALCPDLSTVYIIRTDQFTVTAAYPLQGQISDMVVDNDRRLIYFLDRQRQQIQRWDGISQQMTDRIPLPMTQSPEGLEISPDGEFLFVTDTVNRQLLKIDAENGTRLAQVNIGHEPSQPYWFEHNGQARLAVISLGDQQLHLVSADSLATMAEVTAGQQPYETVYANNALFVSDSFDYQILQLDPDSGVLQARIPTMGRPMAMLDDTIQRNVIIAEQSRSGLALLPYGQQLIARHIAAGAAPHDLAISNKRRLLYIADEINHSIVVLDLPSEKIIQTIEVGSTPDVIMVQEP
ncbi:hypothetical protein HTZ97_06290 [Desulfuromonas acetoxidans]|nr:hypothetical protein [Desulfuromonas acetoxidans]MBF0644349.1 hypothetical protein [Desulfuromonas acetoxidans]NVD23544.1 hypothetical protein [Desulfuromonas acetoxidans]NVE16071.1 hypothetical protein [Desulfuromonas acetoxidans]